MAREDYQRGLLEMGDLIMYYADRRLCEKCKRELREIIEGIKEAIREKRIEELIYRLGLRKLD
ncbi:MAG: hypothetical protein DRJ67_12075 [Thermoprotei archaeon]|nr:MAG: hypothetical protein DRJ67_12075 [Thermoprotei archaeon]